MDVPQRAPLQAVCSPAAGSDVRQRLVDAERLLEFGWVFVANMNGNVASSQLPEATGPRRDRLAPRTCPADHGLGY